MNTSPAETHHYYFAFPTLDTVLQVDENDGNVTVRASRDTFSEGRKLRFIRELAAEGFIPDRFRWPGATSTRAADGVFWEVDGSCFRPDATHTAQTRRFMVRLLGATALFWLALMGLLLLHGAR